MKNPFAGLFRARDKPKDSVSAAPTFYFGTSGSGKPVNANTAIQLSTVYACVRVISETVASLPLEQKNQIARMREQNLGYAYIAKEMGISVNTIKAYCRRNDLSGNRSLSDAHPEKTSGTSDRIDLNIAGRHGNTTTAKKPGGVGNTDVLGDRQVWDVSVSFADEPDETAVADVLSMLKNARYGG